MGKFLAPGISTADRTALVLDRREVVYDTDTDSLWYGDGSTLGGRPFATGGGGVTLYNLESNADFTVTDGTVHEIPSSTFTANRSANVSSLTTEAMICNGDQSYTLTFTGATVYRNGGSVTETNYGGATVYLKKIRTKL